MWHKIWQNIIQQTYSHTHSPAKFLEKWQHLSNVICNHKKVVIVSLADGHMDIQSSLRALSCVLRVFSGCSLSAAEVDTHLWLHDH